MATVRSSVAIDAPVDAVWSLYLDPDRWAGWVDQFAAVVSASGYPRLGGELIWRSGAAGRGEVHERVTEHRPPNLHRIRFSDPATEGELVTTLSAEGGVTAVTQELSYTLRSGGVFARVSDVLFVRSQMRASLGRSLAGLRLEAEAG